VYLEFGLLRLGDDIGHAASRCGFGDSALLDLVIW
jgi:hypothetical protein